MAFRGHGENWEGYVFFEVIGKIQYNIKGNLSSTSYMI